MWTTHYNHPPIPQLTGMQFNLGTSQLLPHNLYYIMHQAHYATKLISCMQTPCTTEKSGNFTWQGIICMQRCVSCHVFSTRPYVHSSFLPATWDGVVKHKRDQECHNHVQGHESVHRKIKLKYRKWKINSSALEIKRWVEMHEPTTDKCSYI